MDAAFKFAGAYGPWALIGLIVAGALFVLAWKWKGQIRAAKKPTPKAVPMPSQLPQKPPAKLADPTSLLQMPDMRGGGDKRLKAIWMAVDAVSANFTEHKKWTQKQIREIRQDVGNLRGDLKGLPQGTDMERVQRKLEKLDDKIDALQEQDQKMLSKLHKVPTISED